MMEYLNVIMPVITMLLSLAFAVLGWFAGQMWNRIKANEDSIKANDARLAEHKLSVAENYVRHDRMQEILKPMAASISDVQTMVGQLLQRN